MPVHMGVTCERCGKVHLIGTSPIIEFSRSGQGVYRFNCPSPCGHAQEFQKHNLLACRVTDDVFRRGYADETEYDIVPSSWRSIEEQLAKRQAA